MLNKTQRQELLMQCKLKGIKQKDLAELIEVSSAWISQYFSVTKHVDINEEHETKIIDFVASK